MAEALRIRGAIAKALTHSAEEVVAYAANGIGRFLKEQCQQFLLRCVGAVARQARLIEELQAAENLKPYDERLRGDELIRKTVPTVRSCIVNEDLAAESEWASLNLENWPGRIAAKIVLQVLGHCPDSQLAVQFHGRLARTLAASLDRERLNRDGIPRRLDIHFELHCSRSIAHFVLKIPDGDALGLCQPLLNAVSDHPHEIAQFVRSLVYEDDRSEGNTSFWSIWQAFADQLCEAPWVDRLDSETARGTELLNILFLGIEWKGGARHWRRLEGQAHRVDTLFARLPPSAVAVEAYCRYLSTIGERSLPHGFVVLADCLEDGGSGDMFASGNATYHLEKLLRRYVCGEPVRLKSDPQLRSAVLQILSMLVDAGSSAAFRMRDDFVTPSR